jgi:hypothetical protein
LITEGSSRIRLTLVNSSSVIALIGMPVDTTYAAVMVGLA